MYLNLNFKSTIDQIDWYTHAYPVLACVCFRTFSISLFFCVRELHFKTIDGGAQSEP